MRVRLADRNKLPPNGIWVTIPQIGYNKQFWSFTDACDAFAALANANPTKRIPTDRATIENIVDEQNAQRCLGINGAENYITVEGGVAVSGTKKALSFPSQVLAVVESLKRIAKGSGGLFEWLGDGGVPVEKELAENRAKICSDCPKNGSEDLTQWFTVPASELIRKQLEKRKDLNLSTTYDDKLGVCSACLCPLKTKVHTPIEYITKHTDNKMKSDLDSRCWILNEGK